MIERKEEDPYISEDNPTGLRIPMVKTKKLREAESLIEENLILAEVKERERLDRKIKLIEENKKLKDILSNSSDVNVIERITVKIEHNKRSIEAINEANKNDKAINYYKANPEIKALLDEALQELYENAEVINEEREKICRKMLDAMALIKEGEAEAGIFNEKIMSYYFYIRDLIRECNTDMNIEDFAKDESLREIQKFFKQKVPIIWKNGMVFKSIDTNRAPEKIYSMRQMKQMAKDYAMEQYAQDFHSTVELKREEGETGLDLKRKEMKIRKERGESYYDPVNFTYYKGTKTNEELKKEEAEKNRNKFMSFHLSEGETLGMTVGGKAYTIAPFPSKRK